MKNIILYLKIAVISAILYFIINEFILIPLFGYSELLQMILAAILLCGIYFLYQKPKFTSEIKPVSSSSILNTTPIPQNIKSSLRLFKVWVIILILVTLFLPFISDEEIGGLVYVVSIPAMIIALVVIQPLLSRLRITHEMKYDRLLMFTLFLWTCFLSISYSSFIFSIAYFLKI